MCKWFRILFRMEGFVKTNLITTDIFIYMIYILVQCITDRDHYVIGRTAQQMSWTI